MICASCNQLGNTFFRFAFTREGVTISEGLKGYLRCQHCGTLLRIARFRKQVWYFVAALAIAFFIFHEIVLKPLFQAKVGVRTTMVCWIGSVLVWVSFYIFGLWKYRVVEKVEEENKSQEKATA